MLGYITIIIALIIGQAIITCDNYFNQGFVIRVHDASKQPDDFVSFYDVFCDNLFKQCRGFIRSLVFSSGVTVLGFYRVNMP